MSTNSPASQRPQRLELLRRLRDRLDRPHHEPESFRLHLAAALGLARAEQRRAADQADAEFLRGLTDLDGDPALQDDLRPVVLALIGDAVGDTEPGRGGRFADIVFLIKELLPVILELIKLFKGV